VWQAVARQMAQTGGGAIINMACDLKASSGFQ
jgi:hypothetical protein